MHARNAAAASGDLVEQWLARRDDQLTVAPGERAAHPERLASSDEQHLVRIAHHRVVAHLPDEEALVGQCELKLGREAFRSHPSASHVRVDVLDQRDGRLEESNPSGVRPLL